jgi:hypothetical protein
MTFSLVGFSRGIPSALTVSRERDDF